MSEIKPCMNTECACYREGMYTVLDCGYYSKKRQVKSCPQYRSEPKPEPWEPLNPDEYEPGCTNEECKDWYMHSYCKCRSRPYNEECESHMSMCKTRTCYRPKKKPEMVKYAIVRFPADKWKNVIISMCEDKSMPSRVSPHDVEISTTAKTLGITCEIIEEETK